MHINNKNNCEPFVGPMSEKIFELITSSTSNSEEVSVAYLELPAKASMPKHYHPETTEIYYVLEGSAQLLVHEEIREININDIIRIEKRAIHQLVNHTDKALHLLTISTPAWTPDSEVLV